jgi:hypothetical protein
LILQPFQNTEPFVGIWSEDSRKVHTLPFMNRSLAYYTAEQLEI